MEPDTMGQVLTEATIESLKDLWKAQHGHLPPEDVRRITVPNALVDSGATFLSLPTRIIRQLGLAPVKARKVVSSTGIAEAMRYEAVRLTIQGRDCTMDVIEVPYSVPVLIGQLPIGHLDFVIDPRSRTLIGNPAHGGEHIYEMY